MSGEKKSLRRFLLIYIFSSLFLLGIGSYLYYKMSYQFIISNKTSHMKKKIELFIKTNQKKHILETDKKPEYLGIPLAIYINQNYQMGNFKPDNIDLTQEIFKYRNNLYYIHKEHKSFANVYLVTYSNIDRDIKNLVWQILVFFIFSTIFITVIAFILGKIFLKPMKKSMEFLENFIIDATHEINTPISNILINIELSKELHPACTGTEEFKKIENSAFRISKIFKDLSFIRLEHKKANNKELLNVDEILEERIDFFRAFIENKNLSLTKEIDSLKLKTNKENLIRLIDNLLSNAIKYTQPDTRLTIRLNEYLEIINHGTLNNDEDVTKKFMRDNKNEGGFGLGLYIVQKICDNYNFEFTIRSSNNKVYSKIWFHHQAITTPT